jgi:hypothetical protein
MSKTKKDEKLKKLSDLTTDDCEKVIEAMKIVYKMDQCSKSFCDNAINVLNQQIDNCNKQDKIRSNCKREEIEKKDD